MKNLSKKGKSQILLICDKRLWKLLVRFYLDGGELLV